MPAVHAPRPPRRRPARHRRALAVLALLVPALASPADAQDVALPQEAICRESDGAPRVVDPLALVRWAIETSGLSDPALDADDDGDTLLEEKQRALADPFHCGREGIDCDEADRAAHARIHSRLDTFVRDRGGWAYRFERIREPDPLERSELAFLSERVEVVDRDFQLGEVLAVPPRFVRIVCLDRPQPSAIAPDPEVLGLPIRTGFRLAGSLDDLGKDRDQLRGVKPAEFSINGDVGDDTTTYYVNLFGGYEIALGREQRTNYSAVPFVQYEEKFNESAVDIDKIGVGAQFRAVVVSDRLGRDEVALSPYLLTDRKASKQILTVRLRVSPSLPEDYGIPLGYYAEVGGVLMRFGFDALMEAGNVFAISDDDSPLEEGRFWRTGLRLGVNVQGVEGSLLEQFEFDIAEKYLHGFVGRPTNVSRFESTLSYRLPDAENYRLSLSYENGRVDDTFEYKQVWRTALGVRF